MGEAVKNYSNDIESFLDTLYGENTGYAYLPTKDPTKDPLEQGYWTEKYFKWPAQRDKAVAHVFANRESKDCYVSPSLFKAPSDKRQAWKGSNYVWAEFDGNAPDKSPKGIPSPTIRVRSSEPGHEHWYWRLDVFESDYRVLEGITKQLAYTLDSDKSGFECNQVLRVPGTIHHDSGLIVTRYMAGTVAETAISYADFKNLVVVPELPAIQTEVGKLPDITGVVAKFKWPAEATELFTKMTQPVGSRSSALTALGFFCVEMGMTNEEAYVVLLNADDRWGKFKSRPPASRAARLVGIIRHCRGTKEVQAELHLAERESFVSLGDFRATDIKISWLFDGFLAEKGLGVVSAAPGVGKSTFSLRMGMAVCLGNDFLKWSYMAKSGQRVGFVSLEMAGLECRKFIDDMWPSFNEDEKDRIEREFYLLPLGYSLALGNKDAQQFLLEEIDNHGLRFIIIDSLKAATGLDEKRMDLFFDWINKHVRNERGVSVWIIHHNRKPPNTEGSRKPKGLEDMYGDTFIGAHPTTAIGLWKVSKDELEIMPFKIRLAEEMDPFRIKRARYLNFTVGDTIVAEESKPTRKIVDDGKPGLFGS